MNIDGVYVSTQAAPEVKTTPMRKGIAIGGPLDNIKIEASMHWNGLIIKWTKIKDGGRRAAGHHNGYYIWTGEVWRWIEGARETKTLPEDEY